MRANRLHDKRRVKKPSRICLIALVIMVALATVLSGCGNRNKEIQGTWKAVKATHEDLDGSITDLATVGALPVHNSTFVFSDNLTVYSDSGEVSEWSYKYKDDDIGLKTEGSELFFTCEYTGDRLILTTITTMSVGGDGDQNSTDEIRIELVRQ